MFLSMVVLGTSLAAAAHADELADVRASLQGLENRAPIHGTLDVQSTTIKDKSGPGKSQTANLQLEIQAGDGLSIHLAAALLQQINTEKSAHGADPDQPALTADLLAQVNPLQVEDIVSAAPMLLRALVSAASPVVKPAKLWGSPVQELSVKLPPPVSKKDSADMKDYQGGMLLWLDAKGVPLAYQQTMHAKFCKFFLCVTVDELENGTLRVIDGRLVTVTLIQEHKQSGLGQGSDTHIVYNLTLK
ncbi:MAG: hypothetical protein WCC11_05175 [Gammaproteobacteria bacterium]